MLVMNSIAGGGVSTLAECYVVGPQSSTTRLFTEDTQDTSATQPIPLTHAVAETYSVPFIPGNLGGGDYSYIDKRASKVRKSSRKNYKKAVKHYGKTYVLTRTQMLWAIVTVLGLIVMLSSGLFAFYVHLARTLGVM